MNRRIRNCTYGGVGGRRGNPTSPTPKYGSWFNVVEVETSVMACQCLNRRIDSIQTTIEQVAAWQAQHNRMDAKVDWSFTTENARKKFKSTLPDS